jgi:hypothetical protein
MELYEIINTKIDEHTKRIKQGDKDATKDIVENESLEIFNVFDSILKEYKEYEEDTRNKEIKNHFNQNHITVFENAYYVKQGTKFFYEKIDFKDHINTFIHPLTYIFFIRHYVTWNKIEQKLLQESYKNSESNEDYDIEMQCYVGESSLRIYIVNTLETYSRIYGTNQKDPAKLEKSISAINVTLDQILDINFVIDNLELCKTLELYSYNDLLETFGYLTTPNIFGNTNEELTDENERLEQLKQELIKLEPRTLPIDINHPIDKVNNVLWDSFRFYKGIPQGQLQMVVSNKNPNMYVLTSADFSEVENVRLSKNLAPYEKTIYDTTANLFSVGNKAVTIDDIFKIMTNGNKKPGPAQRKKIYESLVKLSQVKIYIDNSQAIKQGYKGTHFRYEGYLLPVDIISAENEKGKEIIGIFKHSAPTFKILPLFDYAIATGQYITVNNSVLQMGLSYTDKNLALRDYLLENIKRKKWRGKTEKDKDPTKWSDRTFKLETIYKKTGLTKELVSHVGTLNRDRKKLIEDMKILLDQWKEQGLFKNYSITKENLTIKYK